jgi:hypothetical protein
VYKCKSAISLCSYEIMVIVKACSLCTNVKVLYHYVHMRLWLLLNYDYLVLEN